MTIDDQEIQRGRLDVERERLELERRRAEREGGLLNRHFGTIITALVSVAAVVVSFAQIMVAQIEKSQELEAKALDAERQWRIEAANFVASNREAIFSEDDQQRQLMQRVISVAFPKEISAGLLVGVRGVESVSLLRRFITPDGASVNPANRAKLAEWMKANRLDESVTMFLNAAEFENDRIRAVQELGLATRQQTMTDVPASEVDAVVKRFTDGGAAVAKKPQSDGRWTVTATLPEQ